MSDNKKPKSIGGLVFVGFMFIGAGLGMLVGHVAAGGAIGMGVGFVAMGVVSLSDRNKDRNEE
ncbi:MAG: hypothetical protein ACI85F_002428 [Bacteroidia bacterium]|jgi:hypothetical protein